MLLWTLALQEHGLIWPSKPIKDTMLRTNPIASCIFYMMMVIEADVSGRAVPLCVSPAGLVGTLCRSLLGLAVNSSHKIKIHCVKQMLDNAAETPALSL